MPNAAHHPWAKKPSRSPFPGQTMDGRMPTTMAKVRSDCALCEIKVKPGQRVAKHFATDSWVHVGCMVRRLNSPILAA